MLRLLYNLLLHLALPWLWLRLRLRGRREPGYLEDIGQRFGRYDERPDGPVIWLHAVSLGETRAAQPLVAALRERYPGHALLVTHMTATARAAARELYGAHATLAFLPYDLPWAARRFVAHFRPQLGILMETEVWPNLLAACRDARVPVLLANARLSARSARGYARAGALAREAFGALAAAGAQSEADAARIRALGTAAVEVTGNLKFDVAPAPGYEAKAREFRGWFGPRRVFLAASTRDGEEALLLDALDRQRPDPDVLTVVVPRHPQRFDEVGRLITGRDRVLARRSDARRVPAECRYLLGDSLGEMSAYYAAADVAFVGGSLVPLGGQNLIESLAVGTPVLIGPSSFNFAQAVEEAVRAGACVQVAGADVLVQEARRLLADPGARARMAAAGRAFCAAHRGATARTLGLVTRLLPGADAAAADRATPTRRSAP